MLGGPASAFIFYTQSCSQRGDYSWVSIFDPWLAKHLPETANMGAPGTPRLILSSMGAFETFVSLEPCRAEAGF